MILTKLRQAGPHVYEELKQRYNSPGGLLPGENVDGEKEEKIVDSLDEVY